MHIDEETGQRFAHGELRPDREKDVRAHLAECASCAAAVRQIVAEDDETGRLLEHLDHERQTATTVAAVIRTSRTRSTGSWRRAAMIPLLLAGLAGVAYAVPGSPIRGWLDRNATRGGSGATPAGGVDADDPAGVLVEPGERLVIAFDAADSAVVRVSLHDGDLVEATADDGTATFVPDPGRLAVTGANARRFSVRIPRRARAVEIRVGGQTLFRFEGDTVSTPFPADGDGVWTLPLAARNGPAG